jgi:NAD(P)-dependent dehydrogenase (short-subunit alcohol dehydrogenase family)
MKDFTDKVAVVTGAASGIGRGMAETFLAAGMKVVLADIEAPALDATARALADAGGDVQAVRVDVTNAEQVEDLAQQTLRKYGAVHVLCNNAGIFIRPGPSWTSSLDDWRWMMDVNVMGVVHGVRSFLPIMIEQNADAHIVNTASVGGLIAGGHTIYGTSKYAVIGLSENLYLELARSGLKPKVSVLCPSVVNTNILSSRRNQPGAAAESETSAQSNAARQLREQAAQVLKTGLDPRAVGDLVMDGIRDERFYILAPPELAAVVERRLRVIVSGANPPVR